MGLGGPLPKDIGLPLAQQRPSLMPASYAARLQGHGATRLKDAGENAHLRFFCGGLQGMRPHMEDRTLGVLELPGHAHASVFGVFDGHGGSEVSDLAFQLFPRILSGSLSEVPDPAEALKQSFLLLDEELRNAQPSVHAFDRVGSTACVVLLLREAGRLRLLCANCGDSRAVLCRAATALDLSVDQKPNNPLERRRIEVAGGRVDLFGPCWRIDSGLNLSRALGDFGYKANPNKSAGEQKVIAEPEVKEFIVGNDDELFVIGSDGVYDVLSSGDLIRQLCTAHRQGSSWEDAIESALSRSVPGGDNVSLCLVEFVHSVG